MDASALSALKTYTAARKALGEAAGNQGGTGSPREGSVTSPADGLPPVPALARDITGAVEGAGAHPVSETARKFAEVFKNAEATATDFTTGKADAQAVVEALAGAEVALETAVTIRNRVVEAYQEILRMPV